MSNTQNVYTEPRARAQKAYYEKNKERRRFTTTKAGAFRFVKWHATRDDMEDLKRYFKIPGYKSGRLPLPVDPKVAVDRSYARRYVSEYADEEMYKELIDKYNEYKDHREEWAV